MLYNTFSFFMQHHNSVDLFHCCIYVAKKRNLVIATASMGLDSLEYQRCAEGLFFIYLRQL